LAASDFVIGFIASKSADDITPLSRSNAARRSLCSAVEALAVIERASASVNTPFACSTRTNGSVELSVCAKTNEDATRARIKMKAKRRHAVMIRSFLHRKRPRHIVMLAGTSWGG